MPLGVILYVSRGNSVCLGGKGGTSVAMSLGVLLSWRVLLYVSGEGGGVLLYVSWVQIYRLNENFIHSLPVTFTFPKDVERVCCSCQTHPCFKYKLLKAYKIIGVQKMSYSSPLP